MSAAAVQENKDNNPGTSRSFVFIAATSAWATIATQISAKDAISVTTAAEEKNKDNNPSNNVVENLEWCSIEYNNKYRFTNGDACHKGCKHPQATITEDIAIEIYKLGHSGKYTEPELAKMFNTTRSIVNKIRLNKTWTHVTKNIRLV